MRLDSSRPSFPRGRRTVLNGGCVKAENGISSAPTTETSSGTRIPVDDKVAADQRSLAEPRNVAGIEMWQEPQEKKGEDEANGTACAGNQQGLGKQLADDAAATCA